MPNTIGQSGRTPIRAPFRAAILASTALVLSAVQAGGAEAQSAPPADAGTVKELVVTARRNYVATSTEAGTKSSTPLIETPQAVSVVTLDQIQLLQVQNLEQATRYTAGVVSGSYGPDSRFDWLTLRGFTPTLYLDGLQLPTAAVAEAQSRVDTYGLEQIEILKGPSSALYGSSPPGGLLAMTSKRPTRTFFADVDAQVGNYSHYQGSFDVGGLVTSDKSLLFRLTGLFRDSGNQVDHNHEQRDFFAPALTWNISPRAQLTLLAQYQYDRDNTEVQDLPSQGTLTYNPHGKLPTSLNVGDPSHDIYTRSTFDIGYDFNYKITDELTFHQNFKYTKLNVYYNTIYGQGVQPDLVTLNRYTYLVHSSPYDAAVDTHLEWKPATGPIQHDILLGVDYRHSYDNSALGFDVGPTLNLYDPVYGQAIATPAISQQNLVSLDQTGVYFQDHAKIGGFSLTGSVREDFVHTSNHDVFAQATAVQDNAALSGRVGADYRFDFGLAPYVSYSRSFQPTIATAVGAQLYKPTTGEAYEVGIKYQPPGIRGLITADLFHITEDNALELNTVPTPAYVQSGQVVSQGFEIEGTTRLNDSLSLNAAYAYTDAKTTRGTAGYDLGKRVFLVPVNQASALADYTIRTGALNGLGFGAGVRYVGDVYGDPSNQEKTPSYTLMDLLLHYDLPDWRFALNINNLFDRTYLSVCYSADSCNYGSRRTIQFTVSRHW